MGDDGAFPAAPPGSAGRHPGWLVLLAKIASPAPSALEPSIHRALDVRPLDDRLDDQLGALHRLGQRRHAASPLAEVAEVPVLRRLPALAPGWRAPVPSAPAPAPGSPGCCRSGGPGGRRARRPAPARAPSVPAPMTATSCHYAPSIMPAPRAVQGSGARLDIGDDIDHARSRRRPSPRQRGGRSPPAARPGCRHAEAAAPPR